MSPAAASSPVATGERIGVIDALRGFALFGILVVNMESFRGFASAPGSGALDAAATWFVAAAFTTKFYVLFSFLFGYGLTVQVRRAQERGAAFVPRYLRRLLGLALIGIAHALLLYVGDILVTYAVLGVVLLLLRDAPTSVLLRLAVGLVALTVALCLAGGLAVALLGDEFDSGAAAEDALGVEAAALAANRGAPAEVIAQRVREYPGTLGFAVFGQGPTALAMFLLGLEAGRRRLFERIDDHAGLLRRIRRVGLVVGGLGGLVWGTSTLVNGFTFNASFLFAAAVDFATAPLLSAVYLTTITLAWRSERMRRRLAFLVPVGRLALTNYLLQSLAGALIFTGYGLGLFGRVGPAAAFGLSIAIFAAQVPLSAAWLRHFRFGPAEWLLRSFTYAHPQPLRREPSVSPAATGPGV